MTSRPKRTALLRDFAEVPALLRQADFGCQFGYGWPGGVRGLVEQALEDERVL